MEKELRMQTEGRTRITKVDEDRLQKEISAMITVQDSDPSAVIQKKKRRAEKIDEFQRKYAKVTQVKGAYKGPKRLTYDNLEEYLNVAGFTYRDLLEITNGEDGERAKLAWKTKVEKNMCSVCDSMTEEQRKKVLEIVSEALPDPLYELFCSKESSGIKLFAYAEKRMTANYEIWHKIKDDKILSTAFVYRTHAGRSCADLPFSKFSDVVDLFGISYHWLLGLDEKTCVLAKHGTTEMIMDAFCLLPDRWKEIIYAGANEALRNRT